MKEKAKKDRKRVALIWPICMALGLALMVGAAGLVLYNLRTEMDAGNTSTAVLTEIAAEIAPEPEEEQAVYVQEPFADEGKLPLVEVEGDRYVGVITIPTLNMQLPVMAEWSYDNLKKAPCRYFGSVAGGNLVLCGHNYRTHFGPIGRLKPGDEVIFASMDNTPYYYRVSAVEVVDPYATADVVSGEWPLTLFTCTMSGTTRIVIRCDTAGV